MPLCQEDGNPSRMGCEQDKWPVMILKAPLGDRGQVPVTQTSKTVALVGHSNWFCSSRMVQRLIPSAPL